MNFLILIFSLSLLAETKVTDHLIFSNSRDIVDRTVSNQILHENFFRSQLLNFDVLLQLNNRFYFNDPNANQQPLSFEKLSVERQWRQFEFTGGDFNLQFGKGIQFSFFKEDVLGINNTLQGAFLRYNPESFDVQAYGGLINPLSYPVALYPTENPLKNRNLLFVGGQAYYKIQKDFKVGSSYFFSSQYQTQRDFIDKQWNSFGLLVSKENLLEDLDFYAESSLQLTQSFTSTSTLNLPNSYGSYAGLVYSPDNWKFIAEAKDYRNETFEFRKPPTLEEDFIENQNIADMTAGKLKVERSLNNGDTRLSTSYLYGDDRTAVSPVHHATLAIKQKGDLFTDNEIKVGYRYHPEKLQLWHLDLKTKLPMGSQSIEVGFRKRDSNISSKNQLDFTFNFSEKFNIALGYEYLPTNLTDQHFLNLASTIRMGSFSAKAFLGQTSGGVLCSGGVCRTVPPYSGAMVETVVVF
jgi:hypothetical protein